MPEWRQTKPPPRGDRSIRIPTIDISEEAERHVIVASGTSKVYQGHPTTLLMPDGKTMHCVWTYNHGGPCGPMKRSDDGGRTWSELLTVPENWRKVYNCPTIHRLTDPAGKSRLFVFAARGPIDGMHQARSDDDGKTWTPMASNGLVCVMPFCTILSIEDGKRLLGMTNIRRPNETEEDYSNVVAQSTSPDGGLTWSPWRIVLDMPGHKPSEPALIRSPDGKQLLCLMRENNRSYNSWMMQSDDEGATWSEPKQLPASLSGDRHMPRYAPDGRLVVCYRDTAAESPTKDHFVAWVGTYEDIIAGREGVYRVKLLHSYAGKDCGYPGLELLPDGTLVATTYVKYRPGPEKHSVVSVRFKLDEVDQKLQTGEQVVRQGASSLYTPSGPNLAKEAKVTASSQFRLAPFPAENATDGRLTLNGRWVSDAGDRHWLQLSWPDKQTIGRVRVWTGYPGRPQLAVTDYTIQYRDGEAWQVAATVTDNDRPGPEQCNDLAFPAVTTTQLRMEITRTPTGHARVFEIEVYGEGSEAAQLSDQSQLFVDDALVASRRGVVRRCHPCRKLPQPVLEPERPWESKGIDERVYVYGTVLHDPESGGFRMWYNRHAIMLYATSKDGVHWERPALGLYEHAGSKENNIVFTGVASPSIILDTLETDPKQRYKMLAYSGGIDERGRGYYAAHSADGLRWTFYPENPVLSSGDTCTLAQDPKTGEYLAFHKRTHAHRGHPRRLVYLATSTDMQTWSKPRLAMAPDEIDDALTRIEGGLYSQFYNLSVFPYAGQFLGLVTHFRFTGSPNEQGPVQSPDDGPIDVQIVHSRDGRTWSRCEDRTPVIPNGPHAYDAGSILGVSNGPVIVGDEMWVYYTAITTTHGGYLPKKRITIARAAWGLDGFVSLDAGGDDGMVETVPLVPSGDRLFVNADSSKGELRVEVIDSEGRPVPGYRDHDCTPTRADSVRHHIRWGERAQLPDDRPIRLRFHLRDASLFSYAIR